MAENNTLSGWSWDATPAFKEGELSQGGSRSREFYGDNFPEGMRYRMRVTSLKEVVSEDQRKRVDLEAECIGGVGEAASCAGRLLKCAFFFPLKSELEDLDPTSQEYRKKSFFPRLFNSFVVACGHPERKGADKTPLDRMIGDVFEFMPRNRIVKGRETKDIKGNVAKYPDYLTSSIKEVFKAGSEITAANEPVANVEEDFGKF